MINVFKTLIKQILPPDILDQFRVFRNPVYAADKEDFLVSRRDFLWCSFRALEFNGIAGDYAEFGCAGENTFCLAFDQISRRNIKRHMWAFDSFQGLPGTQSPQDDHPMWKKGDMATNIADFRRICSKHGIPRDRYTLLEGYYDKTLPTMAPDSAPTNIALAYIDCDMYESTKSVLQFLSPRLKHGMILAFDDYFCWSSTEIAGERLALLEILSDSEKWRFVRYGDYGWAGTSFVVERFDESHSNAMKTNRL